MIATAAPVFVFLSVFLVFVSLKGGPDEGMQRRLQAVKDGIGGRRRVMDQPFSIRVVSPTVPGVAKLLISLLPTTWIKVTSQRLEWAHVSMPLGTFVVFWAVSTVAFPLLAYVWAGNLNLSLLFTIGALALGLVIGAYAPQFWLKSKIGQRQ